MYWEKKNQKSKIKWVSTAFGGVVANKQLHNNHSIDTLMGTNKLFDHSNKIKTLPQSDKIT